MLADFRRIVAVDAHLARLAGGDASYDANLLVGLGVRGETSGFALMTGVGTSRTGEIVPAAIEVPLQMGWSFSGQRLRGQLWARADFVFGEDRRQGSYALFGGDELELGFGLRLPARSAAGVFVGAAYRAAMEDQSIAIFVGTSIDTLEAGW